MKSIVIIGSGIGGLCTAVRLLNKGYEVSIYEKEETIGGKVNCRNINGASFDLTASILMTPDIYTDIFLEVGKDYRDYFEIIKLDPAYNIYSNDDTNYKFYSDISKMSQICEGIQENLSVEYISFLSKSLEKYLISKKYFLDEPMLELREILNIRAIKKAMDIRPLSNSYSYLKKNISNDKLLKYLIFQSMYIGINPYDNTNLYTLIPAISHVYGLIYIKGGLYKYIKSLQKLVLEMGGKIYTDSKVEKIIIKDNVAKGIKISNKEYKADIVVCNSDYEYSKTNLLGDKVKKFNYKDYSCSVFMIYLGLNKKLDNLEVHNIYLSEKFRESIENPFKGNLSLEPSIYMYYPTKVDDSISGKFESIINIMVRVPNLGFKNVKWDGETIKYYRNIILNEIKSIKGLENIEKYIDYESYFTPEDFEAKFNSPYGSAFGISHSLNKVGYFRPHIKDNKIRNLYYIGSSTHPGNGVSVIINGTKNLEKIIEKNK